MVLGSFRLIFTFLQISTDIVNQKVLNRILRRLGIEYIETVDNGSEAVSRSRCQDFDVVLMDMQVSLGSEANNVCNIPSPILTFFPSQMPVMDGLEATRLIVKDHLRDVHRRHPKIVFLTAHALSSFQDQAADAGANCFLSKPYNLEDIRSMLQQLDLL